MSKRSVNNLYSRPIDASTVQGLQNKKGGEAGGPKNNNNKNKNNNGTPQKSKRQRTHEEAMDAMFKLRKLTFIEAIMQATQIDEKRLNAQVTYQGNIHNHIHIDLGLENKEKNNNTKQDNLVRWACLLYFQFLDMIHDHPAKKAVAGEYNPLNTWGGFCDLLVKSNMYDTHIIMQVYVYVQTVIQYMFNANNQKMIKACKLNILTPGCFVLNQTEQNHSNDYLLHNILRIMVLHSHTLRNNVPVLMKALSERSIILDVMKYLSRYGSNLFQFKRKDVQTRVQGFMAYDTSSNLADRGNALMSLDMTNNGRLKDFGGNYYKYIHAVNLGDAGINYLPERNVKKLIVNILKKDDTLIIKNVKQPNTSNIRFSNTNNNINIKDVAIHSLHYDDTPIKLSIGELNVYAYNQYKTLKTNSITNVFNPLLRYVNNKNNINIESEFSTSKDLDSENNKLNNFNANYKTSQIDYEALIRTRGYQGLYVSLLSKHMGDFMNSANCLRNNVLFASGDRFACVGYLITFILMRLKDPQLTSKLFWEDATNDQIVFVTSLGANTRHFDRLNTKRNSFATASANILKPPCIIHKNKKPLTDPDLAAYIDQEYQTIFGNLPNLNIFKRRTTPNQPLSWNELFGNKNPFMGFNKTNYNPNNAINKMSKIKEQQHRSVRSSRAIYNIRSKL